jgi:hypothetical protein
VPDDLCRNAADHRTRAHIARDNRARAYDRTGPDHDTRQDHNASADPDILVDDSRRLFIVALIDHGDIE